MPPEKITIVTQPCHRMTYSCIIPGRLSVEMTSWSFSMTITKKYTVKKDNLVRRCEESLLKIVNKQLFLEQILLQNFRSYHIQHQTTVCSKN
jgi:hypothetical protein